jgi:hypothetical protein
MMTLFCRRRRLPDPGPPMVRSVLSRLAVDRHRDCNIRWGPDLDASLPLIYDL